MLGVSAGGVASSGIRTMMAGLGGYFISLIVIQSFAKWYPREKILACKGTKAR
jgi:hypothetical protein